MEKQLLEFAFRQNYTGLIKEIIGETSDKSAIVGDVYWMSAALRSIITERKYSHYGSAAEMIEEICTFFHNESPDKATLISERNRFLLTFNLKFMGILSMIGHETCVQLAQLVHSQLQCETVNDKDIDELEKNYINSMFSESRQYIFKILLKESRSRNFSETKFPTSFKKLDTQIQSEANHLLKMLWKRLPHSTVIDIFKEESGRDVFIEKCASEERVQAALFCDKFAGQRDIPEEQEFIDFIAMLKDSQLTVTPPDFCNSIHNRTESSFPESEPITASDDMFPSSPSQDNQPASNCLLSTFAGPGDANIELTCKPRGNKLVHNVKINACDEHVAPPEPFPNPQSHCPEKPVVLSLPDPNCVDDGPSIVDPNPNRHNNESHAKDCVCNDGNEKEAKDNIIAEPVVQGNCIEESESRKKIDLNNVPDELVHLCKANHIEDCRVVLTPLEKTVYRSCLNMGHSYEY